MLPEALGGGQAPLPPFLMERLSPEQAFDRCCLLRAGGCPSGGSQGELVVLAMIAEAVVFAHSQARAGRV